MSELVITYWRDIPAQVTVTDGDRTSKKELPSRFSEAIDMAAMRSGASGTDEYLQDWRRGSPETVGPDVEVEAGAAVLRLESEYDKEHVARLVQNGGRKGD